MVQNLFELHSLSFINLGCKSEEREVDGLTFPSSHDFPNKQLKCYSDHDCLEKLTPKVRDMDLIRSLCTHTYIHLKQIHPWGKNQKLVEMVSLWQTMTSGFLEATVLWRSLKIISFPLLEYKEWPSFGGFISVTEHQTCRQTV